MRLMSKFKVLSLHGAAHVFIISFYSLFYCQCSFYHLTYERTIFYVHQTRHRMLCSIFLSSSAIHFITASLQVSFFFFCLHYFSLFGENEYSSISEQIQVNKTTNANEIMNNISAKSNAHAHLHHNHSIGTQSEAHK